MEMAQLINILNSNCSLSRQDKFQGILVAKSIHGEGEIMHSVSYAFTLCYPLTIYLITKGVLLQLKSNLLSKQSNFTRDVNFSTL